MRSIASRSSRRAPPSSTVRMRSQAWSASSPRRTFIGTVAQASYGVAAEGDGATPRVALLHGFGDLDRDRYNVLPQPGRDQEEHHRRSITAIEVGRGTVGKAALYGLGFAPGDNSGFNIPRMARCRNIPVDPTTGLLVRNATVPSDRRQRPLSVHRSPLDAAPATRPIQPSVPTMTRGNSGGAGFTRTFPAAQTRCDPRPICRRTILAKVASSTRGSNSYQAQPDTRNVNFFGRLSARLGETAEDRMPSSAFPASIHVPKSGLEDRAELVPTLPAGRVVDVERGSDGAWRRPHLTIRTRERPRGAQLQPGPTRSARSPTARAPLPSGSCLGSRAWRPGWDYEHGGRLLAKQADRHGRKNDQPAGVERAAESHARRTRLRLRRRARPITALPAGTVWRIGENAEAQLAGDVWRAACGPDTRGLCTQRAGIDVQGHARGRQARRRPDRPGARRAGRYRHEANDLPTFSGLGNYLGVPLMTKPTPARGRCGALMRKRRFRSARNSEASVALRHDHYSDAGPSTTPRVALKWMPKAGLAMRGAYSEAFRAPNTPEGGGASRATFGGANVVDTARIGFVPADQLEVAPIFLQQGNPALAPEKSRSVNLGLVWDATPRTQSRRGPVADPAQRTDRSRGSPSTRSTRGTSPRDPTTATAPGDPGAILNSYVTFINATQGLTSGIDVDLKHRFAVGGWGNVTLSATVTHLYKQEVTRRGRRGTRVRGHARKLPDDQLHGLAA